MKQQVSLLVQALNEISRKDLAEAVEDGDFVVDEDSGGPIQLEDIMDRGRSSHTTNVRGNQNIVIQAGDNANITVHGQDPGTSSEGGHDEYRQSPPPTGHTSLPNLSGIQVTPTPVHRAFSQDESQLSLEAKLDDCVNQLQAMGFADVQVRPVVRNIMTSTGLREPGDIVQTAVERIAEDSERRGQQSFRPNILPEQPMSSTFDSLDGPRTTGGRLARGQQAHHGAGGEMPLPLQSLAVVPYPSSLPDASIYNLHVQLDSLRDNEASNWPEGEFPSIADDGGEVRPLIDLSPEGQHPDTTRTPMDASIPPLSQQPLSPWPAASEQQNTTETTERGENQHTELMAAEEDTEQADTDDTSNTVPKVIEAGEASASAPAPAPAPAGNQSPLGIQQQQNQNVGLYRFTKAHIEELTDNFSESKIIAVGAFGPVFYQEKFPYEGPLKGRPVAVKVNKSDDQGRREFMQELKMAASRHPHLLPLFGICEDGCLALIYAYMKNRDLLSCLKDKQHPLTYKQRLLISLDLISAVCYYHSGTSSDRPQGSSGVEAGNTKKYHRDVKSANVLLDDNYRARLADPGLMREQPGNLTHLSQTGRSMSLCGTPNYRDPNYAESGRYHETSDLYSAGRVLLELLTGKPADTVDEEGIPLFSNWRDELGYFQDSTGKRLCEVADYSEVGWPRLTEDGNSVTQQFARLVIGCLQRHPRRRIKPADLYKKLKDLVKTAGALGSFSTVMPTLCTYCLASKPCHIPMACGCNLVCAACMKEHAKNLYCPTHHTDTTGLGHNTFVLIVGQRGFEKDALSFRDAIIDPNICAISEDNVVVLLDATRKEVEEKVEELGKRIQKVPPGQQTTFIYYHSGHGRKDGAAFGLAYKDNAVSWSQKIKTILQKSKAHKSLFILDACYSSLIRVYGTKGGGEGSHSDNILMVPEGSILWASSRGSEESADDNGRSLFTFYIVKGLEGGNCGTDDCSHCQSFRQEAKDTGAIYLNLLHEYVFNHVTRDLPLQRPSLNGQLEQRYWVAYTGDQ